MAHGTDQAIFGLGDGSDAPNASPVTTGADNRGETIIDAEVLEDGPLSDHLADTADAHDASAVSVLDTAAGFTAADVESALAELAAFRDRVVASEVQTITLSSWDATDTIKFTFNAHETTAVTYADDVSAEIQAALIALADFDAGDLTVARTDVNTYVVTFAGAQAGKNVGAITCTNGTGSAAGTVVETTKGGQLKAAAAATALGAYKTWADGNVNIAHGNPLTVTGIAVGDQIVSIVKVATTAGAVGEMTPVALSDATIGSGTVTFTAADFGANDAILLTYLDLT